MAITKFASAEVIDIKGSRVRQREASLDKFSDFESYRTNDGYMYVRLRAISSRVNKNGDGWPSIELAGSPELFERHHSAGGFTVEASDGNPEFGFSTFVGKPVFVDHHNSNPKKARGVIIDAKLNVLDHKTAGAEDSYWGGSDVDSEHLPPTEVELLLEIDAKSFPRLAQAIVSGDLDGFSMGCDVEKSKCSHCGHVAHSPEEFCSHIVMKGAIHDYKTADGKRTSKKSYENCYGIKFFEISAVFDPADETALAREIRSSVIHEAENPLPQEFLTRAPEEVDTMRDEQICPICGSDMDSETCDVCGYVKPPKDFDNPDLNKATEIRDEMKQEEQQAALPDQQGQSAEGPPDPSQGVDQSRGPLTGGPLATKTQSTASVTSDMSWTPKVHPKTAARINQVERPIVSTAPTPVSDEPRGAIVTSDQSRPVTSTMQTAQRLMATAQRNHTGGSMSTRTADGPTPPGDTSSDKRVDVTGIGGVDQASNEEASKAQAQIDVTGIGGTGVEGVEADSTTTLPTADKSSDDSGFNTDKTTDDSGPTAVFPDHDGSEPGVTDPVTSQPFPASEDGVKAAARRQAYDDGTLEQNEQQGDPIAQGGSAVKGNQPVAESFGDRVNVLEHKTTPANNSGPTKTWSGTDGNGVNKQQDPVTNVPTQFGGIKAHFVRAVRLAETEQSLGLLDAESKWNRVAELDAQTDEVLNARLETLAQVKTAGLNKLAQTRTAHRVPAAFGRNTAAPHGFERIASDQPEETQLSEAEFDTQLFVR